MKKLFTLCAATLCGAAQLFAAAGDTADGWLTVEDFEGSAPNLPTMWKASGTPKGTATLDVIATTDNADNKGVKVTGADYDCYVEFTVTLPAGKTLKNYKTIKFDFYNSNIGYNKSYINIEGTVVSTKTNEISAKNKWYTFSYAIPELPADKSALSTFKLRLGTRVGTTALYYLDNIKLEEDASVVTEPGEDPTPTQPDASKNGTVTEGWLMAEDFQGADLAAKPATYPANAESATVGYAADPTKDSNIVATFQGGNYATFFDVAVTLPEGKTIQDYTAVAFDLYRFNDDSNYKKMYVGVDDNLIHEDENYIQQAAAETWTVKKYSIPEEYTSGRTVHFKFGIESNGAHYAVDNLRLEVRTTPVTPPTPVEIAGTLNGTVTDGELMVQDFQAYGAPDVELPRHSLSGSFNAEVTKTALNPKDKSILTAEISGASNYSVLHHVAVTLPEGKTLANYSHISFDLYRFSDDSNYKQMHVQADDVLLYTDLKEDGSANYVQQAPAQTWTQKKYAIPADAATVAGAFNLYLGIKSDKPHYLINNIRLTEAVPTAIIPTEKLSEVAISAAGGEICIKSAAETEVAVYSLTGTRVATVNASEATIAVAPGLYIVTAAGRSVKVAVK